MNKLKLKSHQELEARKIRYLLKRLTRLLAMSAIDDEEYNQ